VWKVTNTVGLNEALILTALEGRSDMPIAEIAQAVEAAGRFIDDGTVYMALRRMLERGFVTQERRTVISADKRPREIGFYAVTPAGKQAAAGFAADVAALGRLVAAKAPS
jgi:DNA-binding PadR family transcriptional regulator